MNHLHMLPYSVAPLRRKFVKPTSVSLSPERAESELPKMRAITEKFHTFFVAFFVLISLDSAETVSVESNFGKSFNETTAHTSDRFVPTFFIWATFAYFHSFNNAKTNIPSKNMTINCKRVDGVLGTRI